jgi:ParB family transcriptional regulator, chromosome partitioning protein
MVNDKILIEAIDDSDRLRPVDADHAKIIEASIVQQGLLQPIRVRPLGNGRFRLVIGAHRLAALKSLGRVALTVGEEVLIAEASDYSAKVDEIDENLSRYELNALDRALFLVQRKEFYLLAHPEAAPGGDRKTKAKIKSQTLAFDLPKGFGAQAAKKCGLSIATINQAIRLAKRLDRDAAFFLRGTKIERNQRELLAIAELEPEEQIAVARAIAEGNAKTSQQAQLMLGFSTRPEKDPPGATLASIIIKGFPTLPEDQKAFVLDALDLMRRPAKGGRK